MNDGLIIKDGVLERYTLREPEVIVPEGVRVIGPGAFKACTSMLRIKLPETVTAIMADAFKGCRKLEQINFPDALVHIGDYAFHRCHALRTVRLPVSVEVLDNCVFLLCDSLETLSIPGVKYLGKQVFLNDVNLKVLEVSTELDPDCICDIFTCCAKITEIRLSDGTVFTVKHLIEVLAEDFVAHPLVKAIVTDVFRMMEIENGVMLRFLTNLKHVEIPEGITGIGKSCFFDKKGILSVRLPGTLREIGSRAFRNCINLERVELADENLTICEDAFKNCTTLRYIRMPDGREYELEGLPDLSDLSLPEVVRTIHSQLLNNFFISGTTLVRYRGNEERVVVPAGITIIGERAFAGNEAIIKVILPDSVREIHEEAFTDCLLLQTINFPEGLHRLGRSAFENCVKLLRAHLPAALTVIEKSLFNRCQKMTEIRFGSDTRRIEELAFYGCTLLKNVELPNKLEHIGDLAFYRCLGLKEMVLPKALRSLGNNVFTGSGIKSAWIGSDPEPCGSDVFSQCGRLRKLTFVEGVRRIGDKFAFQCAALKYVNLPSTLEMVGRNAFEGSSYQNEMLQNGIVGTILLDGSGFSGEAVIPEGVTIIAGGAFYGNTKVTSVVLPDSLKQIGSRAFCGCTELQEIWLPQGVAALNEGVFAYCRALKKVSAAGSVTIIAERAFYGCSQLQEAPLQAVAVIGDYAFHGCRRLVVGQINAAAIGEYAFRDTGFLEQQREHDALVIVAGIVIDGQGCQGSIEIPAGVRTIAPYAFAGNERLVRIALPDSLTEIGAGAFQACKGLKMLQLPQSLISIGRKAFEKCSALYQVSGHAEKIGANGFAFCRSLENVDIEGVVTLEKEAFCGCAALADCSCNGLRLIGAGCFDHCTSLSGFDFSGVERIGDGAFWGCDGIRTIAPKSAQIGAHSFEDCGRLEEIILADEHLRYGSYAFSGCTALKRVIIAEKEYETTGYSLLSDRQLPDCVKGIYGSAVSCFEIDENLTLYQYRNHGMRIRIPDGILRIEGEVFRDRMSLAEIQVPESVRYIGPRAFHNTLWLERQKEKSPLVVINEILVAGMAGRGEVRIPAEVRLVSGWAFANCYGLTGLSFSSARTRAEEYAFRNCINLKQVTDSAGKSFWLTGIAVRQIELPAMIKQIFLDCLNCFKTDEQGVLTECTGNIGELVLARGIRKIGDYVFKDSNLLTYITLTTDVTGIGQGAFEQCKWLTRVNQADAVTRIGKRAFSGCIRLEEAEFSEALKWIGGRAFEHCTALKRIIVPEGITEIPEQAFYRCKSLETVVLPSTLKVIGQEAFAFCSSLKELALPEQLERIDSRAFIWCDTLTRPPIPAGTKVMADAFSQEGL